MPYGTVNADVIGTSVTGSNLGAGNASIMKNRIINGAMVIDQRNAGASSAFGTDGSYVTVDRYKTFENTGGTLTNQQVADAPAGFTYSLKVTVTSSATPAAGEILQVEQVVEGYNMADLAWGTASAKTVTLSFWVKSSLTGQFGGAIQDSSVAYGYPFSYTISAANTWEQKTITIAGPTSGTWGTTNGSGLRLYLDLGCGSTYLGTAGSWSVNGFRGATGDTKLVATNGATWNITGVQLEVGSSATGFEYRQYTTELALCQRYYQTIAGPIFNSEGYYDGGGYGVNRGTSLLVQMRTAPTVTAPTISVSGNIGSVSFTGYTNAMRMGAATTASGNGYIYFTGNALASSEL
jgi:hypothetical protein